MIKHRFLTLAIVGALTMLGADMALARATHPHAAKKTPATEKPAEPSQPTGKLVEYTELEQHVGSDIIVETTLGTVRRGKLIKYTNPGLTIELSPEHGSIDLSVPRETVRNVSLVLPPPAPATPTTPATTTPAQTQPGSSSAKKN
jgi:hypothetical protein